jgi:hypothetical protein
MQKVTKEIALLEFGVRARPPARANGTTLNPQGRDERHHVNEFSR